MKFTFCNKFVVITLFFFANTLCSLAAVFEPYVGNYGTGVYNSSSDWQNSSNWVLVSGSSATGYPVSDDQINFGSTAQYGNNALEVNFDVTNDLGYTNFVLSSNSYESSVRIGNGGNLTIKSINDNNKVYVNVDAGGSLTISDELVLDATNTILTVGGTLNLNGGLEMSGGGAQSLVNTGDINVTGDFYMEAVDLNITSGNFNISGDWIIDSTGGNGTNKLYLGGGNMKIGGSIDFIDQAITGDVSAKFDISGGIFSAGDCTDGHAICDHIEASGGDLPVTLIAFNGEKVGDDFSLSWTTASEQNSDRFEIEASNDKRSWEVIGKVDAQGNSDTKYEYSFLNTGVQFLYYRLAQYDLDNSIEYFGVVYGGEYSGGKSVSVYPNVLGRGEDCKVFFSNITRNEKIQLQLVNLQGVVVFSELVDTAVNESNYTSIKIPQNINKGIYILNITLGKESLQNKLLLR